ncbi:MAG: hypothetical protein IJW48_04495 [Clostridia bacterium]|nr:hypothetical protein [Clostridia bacterium]
MNVYLEIFGYLGTLLIILSMMMTSVTKLRIINICGSVISAVYAAISVAYPIVVLNLVLIGVNLFKLLRAKFSSAKREKKDECVGESAVKINEGSSI